MNQFCLYGVSTLYHEQDPIQASSKNQLIMMAGQIIGENFLCDFFIQGPSKVLIGNFDIK